jgi:hypothetical protein
MNIDWTGKLRRLLQTLAFCLTISALQAIVDSGRPYWTPTLYSLAIGTSSWALIDFGRHAFPSADEHGWPTGLAGFALPAFGIVAGFVIGTLIGDAIRGASSFGGAARQRLLVSIVISAAAGVSITYYFYSRFRAELLERRMAQAQRQTAEVQLKLLQAQLEPHMLFNTLANLRVLIGSDPPRAQEMLDRLIGFLRATLEASRAGTHPLGTEFDRLRDYLALMSVRMGPRLQVVLDLPEALRGVPVPALLLQPLVENAIRHGLEPKVEGGRIAVSAAREDGRLALDVRDTGVGLDAAAARSGTNFGLEQVRERLRTLYGDAAGLAVEPAPEGGTHARVLLPLTSSV